MHHDYNTGNLCQVYSLQFKISTTFSYSGLAVEKELLFEAIPSRAGKSCCVCLKAQNSPCTELWLTVYTIAEASHNRVRSISYVTTNLIGVLCSLCCCSTLLLISQASSVDISILLVCFTAGVALQWLSSQSRPGGSTTSQCPGRAHTHTRAITNLQYCLMCVHGTCPQTNNRRHLLTFQYTNNHQQLAHFYLAPFFKIRQ